MSVRGMMRRANRFDNYAQIQAKFDSVGKCGHPIKRGDSIGYNRQHGTQCADCWDRWSNENHEADSMEQRGGLTFDGELSFENSRF